MPRKPKTGRPKPIAVGDVRIRVLRGPKAGKWYWRAERHTDRRTVWTGWGTAEEVTREVAECVARGLPDAPDERDTGELRTVEDLMRAWIAHLEDDEADNLAASSLKAYRLTQTHIREAIGDVLLTALDQAVLVRARNKLRKTLAPRTVEADLDRLRAAWVWARPLGGTPNHDLPSVEVVVPEVIRPSPSQDRIREILRLVEPHWCYLAIRILFATGARIGEVADLHRGDLDRERGTLVLDGKTGPRVVALPEDLVAELVAHEDSHDRPELLGVGFHHVRNHVGRQLRKHKVGFSAHAIRRSFVDHAQTSGVDVATTCAYTGHTPAVMFEFYRRATLSDQRKALAKAAFGTLDEATPDNVRKLERKP